MTAPPNAILDYARPKRRSGFSISKTSTIAVLSVVVVAVFMCVMVPKFVGTDASHAKLNAAVGDLVIIKSELDAFLADNGRYPSTAEGLTSLVAKPATRLPEWNGPYIEKAPTDPWGHPYIYRCPGKNGKPFDLLSGGPDGCEGGGDDLVSQ
jgi:general secretion pathway protein G